MVTQMKEEKTIFIRCSEETNDLLEVVRKADMPHRSRNSEIIYLIHKEAKELGVSLKSGDKPEDKPVYSELVPVANPDWNWDANGTPVKEERNQFNKDYGEILEEVQKQITTDSDIKSGLGGLAEKAKQGNRR